MTSTLDDLLEEGLADLHKTANEQHLELHRQWMQGGKKPEDLAPLIKAFNPVIDRKVQDYSTGAKLVNQEALRANMLLHTVKAFESFDPNRGASLSTHVQNHLKKGLRKVVQSQNIGRIPEENAFQIGNVGRAMAELREELQRDPTHQELADHTGLPLAKVKRVLGQQIADVSSGGFETDVVTQAHPRDFEIQMTLRSELTPQEQLVFDHVFHEDPSKRITSTSALAKKLGLQDPQVSRLKTSIAKKWQDRR